MTPEQKERLAELGKKALVILLFALFGLYCLAPILSELIGAYR